MFELGNEKKLSIVTLVEASPSLYDRHARPGASSNTKVDVTVQH